MNQTFSTASATDDLSAIRNAVENASTVPIDDAGILANLRGEGQCGAHVRAIFGNVSLAELARVGRLHGITVPTILEAYQQAKTTAAAANIELDEFLSTSDRHEQRR